MLTSLTACAGLEPGSQSGRVTFNDGKPAVGAFVVGTWTGATPIAGSHSCYRLVVGQVDNEGRYRLLAKTRAPNVVDIDAEAFAFMPGHMAAATNEDANGLLVGPPAIDKKAYFEHLLEVSSRLFCDRQNWRANNVYPLARVLINEMSLSATTPEDQIMTRRIAASLTGEGER